MPNQPDNDPEKVDLFGPQSQRGRYYYDPVLVRIAAISLALIGVIAIGLATWIEMDRPPAPAVLWSLATSCVWAEIYVLQRGKIGQ